VNHREPRRRFTNCNHAGARYGVVTMARCKERGFEEFSIKTPPGPVLSDAIIRKTTEKHVEALQRLTA